MLVGVDVVDMSTRIASCTTIHECLNIFKRSFAASEVERVLREPTEEKQYEMFYLHWALKESYVKAIGEGLAPGLTHIAFVIDLEESHASTLQPLQIEEPEVVLPTSRQDEAASRRINTSNLVPFGDSTDQAEEQLYDVYGRPIAHSSQPISAPSTFEKLVALPSDVSSGLSSDQSTSHAKDTSPTGGIEQLEPGEEACISKTDDVNAGGEGLGEGGDRAQSNPVPSVPNSAEASSTEENTMTTEDCQSPAHPKKDNGNPGSPLMPSVGDRIRGSARVIVNGDVRDDWRFEIFNLDKTHIVSLALGPLADASESYKRVAWNRPKRGLVRPPDQKELLKKHKEQHQSMLRARAAKGNKLLSMRSAATATLMMTTQIPPPKPPKPKTSKLANLVNNAEARKSAPDDRSNASDDCDSDDEIVPIEPRMVHSTPYSRNELIQLELPVIEKRNPLSLLPKHIHERVSFNGSVIKLLSYASSPSISASSSGNRLCPRDELEDLYACGTGAAAATAPPELLARRASRILLIPSSVVPRDDSDDDDDTGPSESGKKSPMLRSRDQGASESKRSEQSAGIPSPLPHIKTQSATIPNPSIYPHPNSLPDINAIQAMLNRDSCEDYHLDEGRRHDIENPGTASTNALDIQNMSISYVNDEAHGVKVGEEGAMFIDTENSNEDKKDKKNTVEIADRGRVGKDGQEQSCRLM